MNWGSYADVENSVLRLRLKDNRAAARKAKEIIDGCRMNKDCRQQVFEQLNIIINGGQITAL